MIRFGVPCGAAGGANKKARTWSGNHPKTPKQFPETKALCRARRAVYHRIGEVCEEMGNLKSAIKNLTVDLCAINHS